MISRTDDETGIEDLFIHRKIIQITLILTKAEEIRLVFKFIIIFSVSSLSFNAKVEVMKAGS